MADGGRYGPYAEDSVVRTEDTPCSIMTTEFNRDRGLAPLQCVS